MTDQLNSDLARLSSAMDASRQTIADQASQIADITAQLKVAKDTIAQHEAAVKAVADAAEGSKTGEAANPGQSAA